MRKIIVLAALAALVAAIVPTGAQADHCKDVFILSGDDAVSEPLEGSRLSGVNVGSGTCTGRPNNPDLPAINYLTPGATKAWGAVSSTTSPTRPSGTIKGVTATWTLNELRGRWETQAVTIGAAASITFSATYTTTSGSKTQSITYTKAA